MSLNSHESEKIPILPRKSSALSPNHLREKYFGQEEAQCWNWKRLNKKMQRFKKIFF